jgi:hypothetical protein
MDARRGGGKTMRLPPWAVGTLMGSLVVATAWAQDAPTRLELEGRLWRPVLAAQARAAVADEPTTDLDLKQDLGMRDHWISEARLTWRIGRKHRLRLAYTPIVYRGDRIVQTTVHFRGRTYEFGTRVASEFRLQYLRLGWTWLWLDFGNGAVRLGPLVDFKGFRAEGSLTTPDLPIAVSATRVWWAGAPTLGVALDVRPSGWIGVFAEISGLPVGSLGTFWDGEVGVQFTLIRYLRVTGGYRYLHGRVTSGPDFVEATMAGPFLSAVLGF